MKKCPQDLRNICQTASLPDIVEKAELLNQLERQLKSLLPTSIANHIKIANLRDNTLVIETISAAWASRIKFENKKLLQKMQTEVLPMLTSIEVKVNPRLSKAASTAVETNRTISTKAAEHLEELAQSTSGSLSSKLKRLAALASRQGQE